jgi:PAS domain S-box-containing protein
LTAAPPRRRLIEVLEEMGGDVEGALEAISVPSYVIDVSGVVRWLNPAAARLVGDVRGRHYTSVVAREKTRRARELFTRKIFGTVEVTDTPATLLATDGSRLDVEISSVPLRKGGHVIGVFGQFADVPEDSPTGEIPELTPRQHEVLRLLERGRSTDQIATELNISRETVRNHVADLLRALGVKSRLEAVALSHGR